MSTPRNQDNDLLAHSFNALPDQRHSLELLGLAQDGSRQALEELLARYQDRLRRIVRIQLGKSVLRRHYDSMDIVQSTFKAALPKIADLRPKTAAGLLQWLAIIATNQIRDAYGRQHTAKRDVGRDVPLEEELCSPARGHSCERASAQPDERALLAEVRELLDDAVSCLPEDQRRVVILRDYCGESWERIATELDRENGATRQLHQRAWIHLRKALRPKLEGNDYSK